MEFTVRLYTKWPHRYLCRLDLEYDNRLRRLVHNGGKWRAEPGVFNTSSGHFGHFQGELFPDAIGVRMRSFLLLADAGWVGFNAVTGSRSIATLQDFPEEPQPGEEGEGYVGEDGANRMVGRRGTTLGWRVDSVDGKVRIFPARGR